MPYHWDFFKDGDTAFGLFYPKNYIVAAFENEGRAEEAVKAFREAGFAEDDVAAASGSFVTRKLEAEPEGTFDKVKAAISAAIGTEHSYIENDIEHAKRGGAFVFVYAPDDEAADRAKPVLKRMHAMEARHYRQMAIERLIHPSGVLPRNHGRL
ncbi:hypothetical protein [Coralloluteibacterium thermophilus]|uniref:Uncharacterized protein n=1 Tax=Coralloluteibacterium thermophilum TaxID=2707049 RepID=A0ABV9NPG0_9GAMM